MEEMLYSPYAIAYVIRTNNMGMKDCSEFITKVWNEEKEYLIKSTNGRMLIVSSAKILAKSTKDSQGVAVMTQKKNHCVDSVVEFKEDMLEKPHRYRSRNLPSAGQLMSAEEKGEQMSFI